MAGQPINFVVRPGVTERFKQIILDEYANAPPAIRAGLNNFSGAATRFVLLKRPFRDRFDSNGKPDESSGAWGAASLRPSKQLNPETRLLPEDRTLSAYGRPTIYLPESNNGITAPEIHVRALLNHEIGHRIMCAIKGDNHPNGPQSFLARRGDFSNQDFFIHAFRKDLQAAGIMTHDGRYTRNKNAPHIFGYILPTPEPNGTIPKASWSHAAQEAAAEIYANRYSNSHVNMLKDRDYRFMVSDFSVFRNTTILVAKAVNQFAGQHVAPVNPLPHEGERERKAIAAPLPPGAYYAKDTPHPVTITPPTAPPPNRLAKHHFPP